ncbi:group IID secretory phospholipase A2 isoform X2 [Antechinus flavipes]|uniref:group IID secretory phospholipase A2 isoform X2 n=1 Tax=Antechinus flavipes TaxID=38775 RepID=UPI002235FFBC|nr:group IID secretory phospholipase A2 isoform X2 [Antechinus flavipes]
MQLLFQSLLLYTTPSSIVLFQEERSSQNYIVTTPLQTLITSHLDYCNSHQWKEKGAIAPSHGSLKQLNKMIKQATGKNPLFSYLNYGCHCGLGGKGQPKDATDWCCKIHDCCYKHLKQQRCHVLVDRYNYNYNDGNIECCGGSQCEKKICQCDKELALCLQRNLGSYQKSYRSYWKFLCQDKNPEC